MNKLFYLVKYGTIKFKNQTVVIKLLYAILVYIIKAMFLVLEFYEIYII